MCAFACALNLLTNDADRQPFYGETLFCQIHFDRVIGRIFGQQQYLIAFARALKTFDGHLFFNASHDDLTIGRLLGFVHRQ